MSERKVYHVIPGKKDGWDVKKEGAKNPSAHFNTKDPAIARGKELAKSGPLGQIKIHKQNGKIQTEYTYGKDPEKYKG